MSPYQDSIGRNADVGDSLSAGLVRTYGCPDKVGLSDRVRVVGELALVQPSVAIVAANTRTNDQRMAMLSILTSSPESESREISPGGVREPSGRLRPPPPGRAVIVRTVGRNRGIARPLAVTYVYNRPPSLYGILVTSPCFPFPFLRNIQALLATPGKRDARLEMAEMQSAAATKLAPPSPSPIPDETARPFHVPLHEVVRSSVVVITELRQRVKACVCSLRESQVGPAHMIITIKAWAKESNRRYPMVLNEHELSNADFLMEQIIKWSIVEYYKDA